MVTRLALVADFPPLLQLVMCHGRRRMGRPLRSSWPCGTELAFSDSACCSAPGCAGVADLARRHGAIPPILARRGRHRVSARYGVLPPRSCCRRSYSALVVRFPLSRDVISWCSTGVVYRSVFTRPRRGSGYAAANRGCSTRFPSVRFAGRSVGSGTHGFTWCPGGRRLRDHRQRRVHHYLIVVAGEMSDPIVRILKLT